MMLTQEELDKKFPLDPVKVSERRYCVAWYMEELREIVVVFDKINQKVVYKGSSKSRKDHYAHIQKFYGKAECDPPKEVNPGFYRDL